MADRPDLQRTRRDTGPLEVVSEQRDDGTYEIKFQSKEIHLEGAPDKAQDEVERVTRLPVGGSAASYIGLIAVAVLLLAGAWLFFISPGGGDREPPVVAPPVELNRPMMQERYRLESDMGTPMTVPEIERDRDRARRLDSLRSNLSHRDASMAVGRTGSDMGDDSGALPLGEAPQADMVPIVEPEVPSGGEQERAPAPLEPSSDDTRFERLPVEPPSREPAVPEVPPDEEYPAESEEELEEEPEYLPEEESESPLGEELIEDGEWEPEYEGEGQEGEEGLYEEEEYPGE